MHLQHRCSVSVPENPTTTNTAIQCTVCVHATGTMGSHSLYHLGLVSFPSLQPHPRLLQITGAAVITADLIPAAFTPALHSAPQRSTLGFKLGMPRL